MVPTMPKAATAMAASGSVDPLSGLSGLSLFPRTIRASADAPKDLDSIHNIMKSLKELRSPEKLMSEARKIVDGGANFLSNFSSFAENVNITNDFAPKVKDKPQERRPGLGLARKKSSFSLKTSMSQPPVNLEPTLDIDHLQDPDMFFDAYERNENAKKEIQKQLGGSTDNIDHYEPSKNKRRHRPGILGKSYNYTHQYSSTPAKVSQETVNPDIPTPPQDESHEKLVDLDPDPNLDADLEDLELAESTKKAESQVNDMLEELLSCNDEDLEGQGALNLLQEKLKIKTLDQEKLFCFSGLPDVGRTNITSSGSRKKPRKSSLVFDSVLKNLNKKLPAEQELVENLVSSPTPPRFPSGSVSLLKKKILQPNPLTDPYSSEDINNFERPNSSPIEFDNDEFATSHMDSEKVVGDADTLPQQSPLENASMRRESGSSRENAMSKDLGTCIDLESPIEFGNNEIALTDMDIEKAMGDGDTLLQQSRGENASMVRESGRSRESASPVQPRDKLVGHDDALKDLTMFSEESNVEFNSTKSPLHILDTREVIENADGLPEQFEDENASIPTISAASCRRNEESGDDVGKAMKTNENELNPSIVETEARDDTSTIQQTSPQQQPEVAVAKRQRVKGVAGAKRMRDAHPMRKSLADAGTSFKTGLRRSTRVKTSPLEYWKGERFLYARVDNSLKLIGLKKIKGKENFEVEAYISKEKPEYKELLELAARH